MEQTPSTHTSTNASSQQPDTSARATHDDARGNAHTESHHENGSNRGHSQQPHKRKSEQELSRRSKKNFSRKWNGPTRRERNVDTRPEEKEERRPKKKVACFIGYSGEGYHGMQYNPPMKTIEGDIYEAFAKAGAILQANAGDPGKSSFQRAARTDKGVHAAGNVISLKLMVGDDPAEVVDKVNAVLPPQIRIWGIQRTNNSFNSHIHCDSRVYEYILPSHCFLPPKPGSTAAEYVLPIQEQNREPEPEDNFWDSILDSDFFSLLHRYSANRKDNSLEELPDLSSDELNRLNSMKAKETEAIRAFRISAARLERIRSAVSVYIGTHNFHNLTIGVPHQNPTATRYMMSIDVAEPKLIGSTEWIRIKIHGQSFMMHQIRKMIGAVLIAIRYGAGEDSIRHTLTTKENMHIPKAPAQGLLLENPVFSGMSEKLQKFGNEALNWEPFTEKMDKFKDDFIYKSIFKETTAENVYDTANAAKANDRFHEFINFMDSFKYEKDKGLSMYRQDIQTDEPIETFEINEDDEQGVRGDSDNVVG